MPSAAVSAIDLLRFAIDYKWQSEYKVLRKVIVTKCKGCGLEICLLCFMRYIKKIDLKGYKSLIKDTLKQCKSVVVVTETFRR